MVGQHAAPTTAIPPPRPLWRRLRQMIGALTGSGSSSTSSRMSSTTTAQSPVNTPKWCSFIQKKISSVILLSSDRHTVAKYRVVSDSGAGASPNQDPGRPRQPISDDVPLQYSRGLAGDSHDGGQPPAPHFTISEEPGLMHRPRCYAIYITNIHTQSHI